MRRTKKLPFFACTAFVAMALAAPAFASASVHNWYEPSTGVPLKAPVSLELKGGVAFSYPGAGGIGCYPNVTANVTLNPGNGGEFTKFTIDPKTCVGWGSVFNGCIVTKAETTLASVQATEERKVFMDNLYFKLSLTECPNPYFTWVSEEADLTTSEAVPFSGISKLQAIGAGVFSSPFGIGKGPPMEVNWSVTPAGKYGIQF